LVNNVETLSLVPWIITNGAGEFNSIGTEKSREQRYLALAGKISRGGLIEVPMGITIRQIVENIEMVLPREEHLRLYRLVSFGGCIPASEVDTPLILKNLRKWVP